MIRTEFQTYRLNASGTAKENTLQEAFTHVLVEVESVIGTGRERSIVVTKLQEAFHFAQRAVAMSPDNTVADD